MGKKFSNCIPKRKKRAYLATKKILIENRVISILQYRFIPKLFEWTDRALKTHLR